MLTAQIIAGEQATQLEVYAARELQRYLYLRTGIHPDIRHDAPVVDQPTFIVGLPRTNTLLGSILESHLNPVDLSELGAEGYWLRTVEVEGHKTIVIAANEGIGCLYGVYGLLEDYYNVGFHLGGDVLPESQAEWTMVDVDEKKSPRQHIRGVIPWTNFPQSATVYSFGDYKFILDQMAKMRMNLLHLHNYNGFLGHNEMLHNFTYNGVTSRVWMATSETGHSWCLPGWSVKDYLFQGEDLFHDSVFGSDCALHNYSLTNEEAFRKGSSLLQRVLDYAHGRGIKIALGLEIDVIPNDYGISPDDPGVIEARIDQIVQDYPDLDYLVFFCSELIDQEGEDKNKWMRIFHSMYALMRTRAPQIQMAVAGWGLSGAFVEQLPEDIICAPISHYSDRFEDGSIYGRREYWGCPWLERDMDSSVYYYPYNIHLSNTIDAYRNRADNMKGLYCLTWRITDAVDAKLSYIAKAPWDLSDRYVNAHAVYHEYAVKNYGVEAADDITAIINENEAYADNASECTPTSKLTGSNREEDIRKARDQLAVIQYWIEAQKDPGQKARLRLLKSRLEGVLAFCELDQDFPDMQWEQMPGAFERWAKSFRDRVADISSLGNLQSAQHRMVKLRYLSKERELRARQEVRSPSYVTARGTAAGAVISWRNEEPSIVGFYVYRDKQRLNHEILPATATEFRDTADGRFHYSVTAVHVTAKESPHSIAAVCKAGSCYDEAPRVVVISPPVSGPVGCNVEVVARILDDRTYDSISARLFFRIAGTPQWSEVTMQRRLRSIFSGTIPGQAVTADGVDYYVQASNGARTGVFPETAPAVSMTIVGEARAVQDAPDAPVLSDVEHTTIRWQGPDDGVFWYHIYRSRESVFTPCFANYVTYVHKNTLSFTDHGSDFEGNPLRGTYYYRITAADKQGQESAPSPEVCVSYL